MPESRQLTRSRHHRIVAGVCGGIADYFAIDPTLVRVAYVVLSVISAGFPGILIYLVLWFIMPES